MFACCTTTLIAAFLKPAQTKKVKSAGLSPTKAFGLPEPITTISVKPQKSASITIPSNLPFVIWWIMKPQAGNTYAKNCAGCATRSLNVVKGRRGVDLKEGYRYETSMNTPSGLDVTCLQCRQP